MEHKESSKNNTSKIIKLKNAIKKLRKISFSIVKRSSNHDQQQFGIDDYESDDAKFLPKDDYETDDTKFLPKDVKEGHFIVRTAYGEGLERFVVPLSYLTHPMFLRLLELAEEEYGFGHQGAVTIPCRPAELERVLASHWQGKGKGCGCRRG